MSVINYPPQKGAYRVKIKSNCDWKTCDTVRLEISVGQPYHEGEKFKATIDWAKARFENVIILVNDTLQRYNFMFDDDMNPSAAYKKTLADGDAWIERHRDLLQGCEIVRWDDWMNAPEYRETVDQVNALYEVNAEFRANITNAIQDIWGRKSTIYGEQAKDHFFDLSRQYLLEETVCLALAYKAYQGVSAYPGSFLEMWSMFVDCDVEGAPEGLKNAQCLRIDFARKKKKASHVVAAGGVHSDAARMQA